MKPFFICSLILLGLIQAQTFGVLDLHYSKTPSTEKNNQIFPKNNECLAEFLAHSLNLLDRTPTNTCSREMIAQFGKQEIFEPSLISYLFLVEKGAQNLSRFENTREGVAMNFDVCVDNKRDDCLLQRLFNKSDELSLVSKQARLFGEEKLSFLYTTQPFVLQEFNSHSISLFLNKDQKVTFVDGDGKLYSTGHTLESCANEFLKNKFDFSSEAVYKYRSELNIPVTEANSKAIEMLKKDVCTLNQFSKMIRNDGKPNIFVFYVQSLNKLSQTLKENEMAMVQDLWVLAKNKFVSLLQKKYVKEELIGGQFFVESSLEPAFASEFPAISTETKKKASARIMQTTDATPSKHFINDAHYEAYVWTPVVLAFVVFFSVMALLQMDFSKDTLLYAKFLTNDAR